MKKGIASEKCLRIFLRRQPTLHLRKPQTTYVSTIKGYTPENIAAIFDICQKATFLFRGLREKNWCTELNVANNAQENVKNGLSSPSVTALTARLIYMAFF
jgi:hypothetical protein